MKVDSIHLGISEINATMAKTYNFLDKNIAYKPWVAKITAIDPKYGYKREFAKRTYGAKMYGGKVQMIIFHLELGCVYEYNDFLLLFIKPEVKKGFFGVDAHGKLEELDKKEVRKFLNMP